MHKKINVLSLFDGISCGQIALDRAGIEVNKYFASEIEENSISVTQANYPATIQLGDINVWKYWDLNWSDIDLIYAGSPCQGFSLAGKQLNFEDPRSKLFFIFVDILNHVKKLNPSVRFVLENVRMKTQYQDIISEYIGVEPIKINSALVSAQNRIRLYWTNIQGVKQPIDRKIALSEVIGKYDGIWVWPRGGNPGGVQSYKGKSPTITISSWQHNFFIYKGELNDYDLKPSGEYRKFTPIECEKLQTVPENYTACLSDNQRYKCLGNGWTVDVIAHILISNND